MSEARGGTWSGDGVIVFGSLAQGLLSVSDEGGVPQAITTLSQPGELHRYPTFLPGGRRLLYVISGTEADKAGIYVTSPDSAPAMRLLPDESKAAYVPSGESVTKGHLLFRRETTLMAQAFDVDRATLTGQMFPVAQEVGMALNRGNGAFSLSQTGMLAFTGGGIGTREVSWRDRAGKRLAVVAPPDRTYTTVSLSPDENSVAFGIIKDGGDSSDLWVSDSARGTRDRLTLRSGLSSDPVWSPDGRRMVYTDNFALYVKPLNGAASDEELIRMGTNIRALDWSRDSKWLLYQVQLGQGAATDMGVVNLEEGRKATAYLQTKASEAGGQFSPDGRWIAYASNESGRPEIYVQRIPADGDRRLVSPTGGDQPRWARDGTELFYLAADQKLMAVPVKVGADFHAGTPHALFDLEALYGPLGGRFAYVPSRDGRRFLVTTPVGGVVPITIVLNWRTARPN